MLLTAGFFSSFVNRASDASMVVRLRVSLILASRISRDVLLPAREAKACTKVSWSVGK